MIIRRCLVLLTAGLLVTLGATSCGAPKPPESVELTLYFADSQMVSSGGESEDYGYMRPVKRRIDVPADIARAAVEELIRGPLPDDGDVTATIPPSAAVLDVTVRDGVVTVNFGRSFFDRYGGGTLGCTLFTQSLMYTLTELDGILGVLAQVEGQPWEDGHIVWDEPLGRD